MKPCQLCGVDLNKHTAMSHNFVRTFPDPNQDVLFEMEIMHSSQDLHAL